MNSYSNDNKILIRHHGVLQEMILIFKLPKKGKKPYPMKTALNKSNEMKTCESEEFLREFIYSTFFELPNLRISLEE